MKHYGIWVTRGKSTRAKFGDKLDGWLVNMYSGVFWTTSRAVAEVQTEIKRKEFGHESDSVLEVREFHELQQFQQ